MLGFIGNSLSEACRQELNTGMDLGKNMIVMCYPHLEAQLQPYFRQSLVVVDPSHPDQAERGMVEYLTQINAKQNAKNALLALGTLALGLLILAPVEDG